MLKKTVVVCTAMAAGRGSDSFSIRDGGYNVDACTIWVAKYINLQKPLARNICVAFFIKKQI